MTPKEKATQIISDIFQITQSYKGIEKLALFMVDEIIIIEKQLRTEANRLDVTEYWKAVKQEIEKI